MSDSHPIYRALRKASATADGLIGDLTTARNERDAARKLADENHRIAEANLARYKRTQDELEAVASVRLTQADLIREQNARIEELREQLAECEGHLSPKPDPPQPDPPKPDPPVQPPSLAWPETMASLSMEQLKASAREVAAKPQGVQYRDVPPLLNERGEVRVQGAEYRPTWLWALNAPLGGSIAEPARDLTMMDLRLGNRPLGSPRLKWFARLYNLGDLIAERCECVGTLHWDNEDIDPDRGGMQRGLDVWPKEHWVYASVAGGSHISDCYIRDIGGQALQLVNRAFPYGQYIGDNALKTKRTTHVLERVGIVDVGYDSGRGAFALSYFDPGTPEFPCDIRLSDVEVATEWPRWRRQNDWRWTEESDHRTSRRAEGILAIHNFDAAKVVSDQGVSGPTTDTLLIERSSFARGFSGQPFMNLNGIRSITFRDCHFRQPAGSAPIDIDKPDWIRGLLGHVEEVRAINCTAENVRARIYHETGVAERDLHCPGSEVVYRRA